MACYPEEKDECVVIMEGHESSKWFVDVNYELSPLMSAMQISSSCCPSGYRCSLGQTLLETLQQLKNSDELVLCFFCILAVLIIFLKSSQLDSTRINSWLQPSPSILNPYRVHTYRTSELTKQEDRSAHHHNDVSSCRSCEWFQAWLSGIWYQVQSCLGHDTALPVTTAWTK